MSPRTEPPSEPDEMHLRALDELASMALGETTDADVAEHVRGCALCRQELDGYRYVAGLARDGERADGVLEQPPPAVWDRVVAEVTPAVPPADRAVGISRPVRRRRVLLAAAAVVAVAGAGAIGWAIGDREASSPGGSARAVLVAQPGTASAVHGSAVMRSSADGYTMTVTSSGLPAPDGYYEAWLFNPSINQMVAIGTLGAGGRGSFTLPAGIDTAAYHVVDVSAQRYDGNAAHERSVLRGSLTR